MGDMLSYISNFLRLKNISITDLFLKANITKGKFYRFVKEPYRFSDLELERISNVLSLSASERENLFAYKQHDSNFESDPKASLLSFDDIIFNKAKIDINDDELIYNLFYQNVISKETANTLTNKIISKNYLGENFTMKKITLYILNCINEEKLLPIFNLAYKLNELSKDKFDLNIVHYIHLSENNMKIKTNCFRNFCQMGFFINYNVKWVNLSESNWGRHMNYCLLNMTDDNEERFLHINVRNSDEVYCYWSEDKNLHRFLALGIEELYNTKSIKKMNISDYNIQIYKKTQEYSKILVHFSLCFDNILNKIWDSKIQDIQTNADKIVNKLSYGRDDNNYADKQLVLNYLVNTLRERFELNEVKETINLIHSSGLEKFIDDYTIYEAVSLEIKFNDEQIIEQLKCIQERLGQSKLNHQRYYIIKSDTDKCLKLPKLPSSIDHNYYSYVIFRSDSIYVNSPCSENFISSEIYIEDSYLSKDFYDYIVEKLINDEERNRESSKIMTDKQANDFIAMLIAKVKNRSSINPNEHRTHDKT